MTIAKPVEMTADEFVAWALEQPRGRYELEDGEVVTMPAERTGHAKTKGQIYRLLEDAAVAAGLDCEVLPDGMAVVIDARTVFEPDALVRVGAPLANDDVRLSDPVVVVEVLSPATERRDTVTKLDGYFRLDSLGHYVILDTEDRRVIHHARRRDGTIATATHDSGTIVLDPPGLEIAVAALFARL